MTVVGISRILCEETRRLSIPSAVNHITHDIDVSARSFEASGRLLRRK